MQINSSLIKSSEWFVFSFNVWLTLRQIYIKTYCNACVCITDFLSAWVWKSYFTGLDSFYREFYMNIHKAGMLHFATIDLQQKQQQSSRSEQIHTNTDHFRCLNTITSIGIARRELWTNFCENLKFDQNWHFSLLLPVAQN